MITKTISKSFPLLLLIYFLLFNLVVGQMNSELQIISPNGGEKLQIGTRQGIAWQSTNIDRVNINYSISDGRSWILIFKNIDAELGIVSWEIPNFLGQKLIIKIEDTSTNHFDISDSYFTVNSSYSLKDSLSKLQSINGSLDIMPLGNSITYGNVDGTLLPIDRRGYRHSLYNLLTEGGLVFNFIGSENSGGNYLLSGFEQNAGFPGISDAQLTVLLKTGRRIQPYHGIDEQITDGPYLETYPTDIILLHIGTNGNDQSGGTDPTDVEEILDEIKRYEDVSGNEITVILARIIDRVPNQNYVTTFNDNIELMALDRVNNSSNDAYPDKIIIVDMEDGANIDYTVESISVAGDMGDNLHPNDKGYTKMANVWFETITNIIPKVTVKIFLEGNYIGSNLMSTELNISNHLPSSQPFNELPWNYSGKELAESFPPDIVDWVLVSLRTDDISSSSTISKRAGLLKSDGYIVDLDGVSPLRFTVDPGRYFVVVEHRNHLPIMSAEKVLVDH